MSRYPAVEKHLPSLARPIGWFLDGLRVGQGAKTVTVPAKVPRFRYQDEGLLAVGTDQKKALKQAKSKDAVLLVPKEAWLTLTIALPPVGRTEHLRILSLDLENRTPFSSNDAEFDVGHSVQGTLAHVVPKAAIARAMKLSDMMGFQFRWLVRDDGDKDPAVIDRRTGVERPFGLAKKIVSVASIGALAAGVAMVLQIRTLQQDLTETRTSLAVIENDLEKVNELEERLAALTSNDRSALPLALVPYRAGLHEIVEEVTKVTPDDSFLTEMKIDGFDLHLRGISQAPEALLRGLSGSIMIVQARFDGALQTTSDGTRFQISADLKETTQ